MKLFLYPIFKCGEIAIIKRQAHTNYSEFPNSSKIDDHFSQPGKMVEFGKKGD